MPNRTMLDKARENVSRVMPNCETMSHPPKTPLDDILPAQTMGLRKVAMGARPFQPLRL